MKRILYFLSIAFLGLLAACQNDTPSMVSLGLDDTYVVERMKRLNLHPQFTGERYEWRLSYESTATDSIVATTRDYTFVAPQTGTYWLKLNIYDAANPVEHLMQIVVRQEEVAYSPYITRVYEYRPAPGQFVNAMPEYEEGDTQEDMNRKALEAIGNNKRGMVSLGGYGGYITVGFDHQIENKAGLRDFRILGNAFQGASTAASGGSYEPGIIQVAVDEDNDGQPDDGQWYEIAGSAHHDPTQETWYSTSLNAGNDMAFYDDYEIVYQAPDQEPSTEEEQKKYIPWTDNKGNQGYITKNTYNRQAYYPQWIAEKEIRFKGSRLPQNAVDQSGNGTYFVLYPFAYGYADNATNASDESAIDIDWAVDAEGNAVSLQGIDLIRIYTGVNQENGWIGECSTEVSGVEDLHVLGTEIPTR